MFIKHYSLTGSINALDLLASIWLYALFRNIRRLLPLHIYLFKIVTFSTIFPLNLTYKYQIFVIQFKFKRLVISQK